MKENATIGFIGREHQRRNCRAFAGAGNFKERAKMKKRYATFTLACIIVYAPIPPTVAIAQSNPPLIQWAKCYGGSGDDEATSIRQTLDGGYIVAGYSNSTDGDVTGNHGGYDYWILKLDSNGGIQWKKSLGSIGNEFAYSAQQTKDGGYIVAGSSDSIGGDVTANHGGDDYWIVKMDGKGNLLWQKSIGGSSQEDINCGILSTSDSGYIVAGSTSSHNGDVTGNLGTTDDWIVKFDRSGNIQWNRCFGGSSSGDRSYAISPTRDSGYIVAGFSTDIGGDVTQNHGFLDYWIIKIDGHGNLQWQKSLGGSVDDAANAIVSTNSGYPVAGWTVSNDGNVTNNHGAADYWIVKLNVDGNLQWQKTFGGSKDDRANDISLTNVGGYIIAGRSYSTNGDVTGNHGSSDCWIIQIDSTGNIQWQKSLGGSGDDEATSIQQTNDGGYIVAGYSNSTDGDVTGNHGGYDYWIVKLGFPPNISSLQQQTLPALLCGVQEYDTLYVHNTGSAPLVISSAPFTTGGANYALVSPQLPDSVAPGDSLPFIIKFAPTASGIFSATLSIFNNDTIAGHNPWQVQFTGTKDSVGFALMNVSPVSAADTLDFGILPCLQSADTVVSLTNTCSFPTTFRLRTSDKVFSVSPDSVLAAPGGSASVVIRFAGGYAGRYVDSLIVTDTCGNARAMMLAATVVSPLFDFILPQDTAVCPGDTLTRAIRIVNRSPLPQSIRRFGSDSNFTVAPDSVFIPPGDTVTIFIVFHNATALGDFTPRNILVDNCTTTYSPPMTITVTLDTVLTRAIPDTTVCPGDSAVRIIPVANPGEYLQNVKIVLPADSLFYAAPDSLAVGGNDSAAARIVFRGAASGDYAVSYEIIDGCGGIHSYTATVHVRPITAVQAQAVPDTTVCPNALAVRHVVLTNSPDGAQQITLAGGNPLFSISPDSLTIAAGDSALVTITFRGSPDTGTFTTAYILPGCGGSHAITATVHVVTPNIAVPQSLSATVCPGAAATFIVPVANRDTISRTLAFAGTNCTLSQTGATLAAGESDTLSATFPGGAIGPMGVDTCIVQVTDDCGGAHTITLVVNVRQLPPLALALQPQTGAITINDDAQVFVVASSLAALSSGGNVTFTVTNEPTALAFDSVSTPCGASVVAGNNSVTVTLANCPNLTNDTIAVLYYQTLAGSTLAPEVTLANASTTNTCDTVSGAGAATLSLLPPGCELGTIIVEPYTTALGQIYPNPAGGTAVVTYSTIENAPVRIALVDALGRTVQTVVNEYKKHGRYAAKVEFSNLAKGLYFVTMQEGKYRGTKELLFLR